MVRTTGLSNYSDVHFTNTELAAEIIQFYNPKGRILEPFLGGGSFYHPLIQHAKHTRSTVDWCEIEKGRNFLDYSTPVNWIVTNPPFGPLTEMMGKAFNISENVVFLVPISKFFSSAPRLTLSRQQARLKHMLHVGTGREIGFDIGFPFAAMHFQRDYDGPIYETDIVEWRKYSQHKLTGS